MTAPMLTCDDAQALIPDLLDGTLSDTRRAAYNAHVAQCAGCRALTGDLARIRDDAAALPTFAPSHDLWSGIEARIATPMVSLAHRPHGAVRRRTTIQLAAAAAVLMAVTAGGTWLAATWPAATLTASPATSTELVSVADEKGIATYVSEIGKLKDILQTRRTELDTATIAILEKNLKLIDDAITESRAALAADPASTFLAERLNHAYDTKLELLRSAATLPSRS